MPSKEIKELRQSGKLEEALLMAQAELIADQDNIWAKRNISWVYYDLLKQNMSVDKFDGFLFNLLAIINLQLPSDERMLFDNISWQVGKLGFSLSKNVPVDSQKVSQLFEAIRHLKFTKPSEGYSFMFKALHKGFKDSEEYTEFADWWNFDYFRTEDFLKEKLKDGKEIMAIAEQAYIAYAKQLLPKKNQSGELNFDRAKVDSFLPRISAIIDTYPQFQYPAYFKAKLLLVIGDNENMLSALLPFAKKKRNDFWVWEIMGEAYAEDEEKILALFCKALSCKAPEEMLVNLRKKMAGIFIKRQLYPEAKTEIEKLVKVKAEKGSRIPAEVQKWQNEDWYDNTVAKKSNYDFYKKHFCFAESILYSDIKEEKVFVEFVNADKKIVNFIISEDTRGFFKYDRFLDNVKVGDILSVRFQNLVSDSPCQVYSAYIIEDSSFKSQFIREVEGKVKIQGGKSFGFLEDIYIHPSMINKYLLVDGTQIKATAVKALHADKKQWGWKLLHCEHKL